jgi:hypothetical protein
LGLGAAGVFLYLLPELVVLFVVLLPLGVGFIGGERGVVLGGVEVVVDEVLVDLLVGVDLGVPEFAVFG